MNLVEHLLTLIVGSLIFFSWKQNKKISELSSKLSEFDSLAGTIFQTLHTRLERVEAPFVGKPKPSEEPAATAP